MVMSVLLAAGATAHKKAAEYLGENKAFIFVFETGSSFGGAKRGQRASMHLVVQRHLIKKLRSLGHLVVGIDSYRTSQGCPVCFGRMEMKEDCHMRIKYCRNCKVTFHRDSAAALLMARLAKKNYYGDVLPEGLVRPPPSNPAGRSKKRKRGSNPSH